ncbi:MAG: Oligopeptide ABC transporter, periplasmic oligopeptide-binding protein [Acetothermia bacterium 64_32]|nr:MAG: Oligopeptide ABC transporter, periplasmic oligopeptide-binding protein [Acetothermia bacterium 64_32]MBC7098728.1 peptide ABC transporter substrate-binding protein [Candidatus Bipolaricaulota bacterium]HAF70752.1 peptide ABC transporter substrate-binding protein [Candidatus Acetothermia bacterium]
MKRLAIIAAVVFLAAGALASDILILGTTDRITELSFANSYDHFTWHILRHTTKALLALEPGTNELVPGVAESWEISEDGLVYTFHLREGVVFWDGTPCDAGAVKAALERTLRLDGPEGGVGLIKPVIKSIEAVDPLTVRITLNYPDRTFLIRMTDNVIPSLIYTGAPEDDFAKGDYVGLGPYRVVEYVPDERVVLEAVDSYFGEPPKTKRVVWLMYSDAAALRAAVEAGDIDVAFRTLNPVDIMDLKESPNLQVIAGPSASVRYLLFNVTQPPVDNVFVRQAITYAVDRDAIVEQVFSGLNKPIYTMVPAGLPPAGASLDVFPRRDLAKARELLGLAGYSQDNPLKVNLWYSPKHYGTTEADVAAVLKQAIEETGMVEITIQSLEWGAYTERMSQGGFDMFLLGWYPDYLEASNFLLPWTVESPEGLGTFFNHHPNFEAYKAIAEVALSTVDDERAAKLYQAIQILSAYDVPWIPLWANLQQAYVVAQKGVGGLVLDLSMELHLDLLYKE